MVAETWFTVFMTNTHQTTALPRIIQFIGINDSGEYGNATCPHCGADGRYVHSFIVEGGQRRGAMAGCVKLFPISPIAETQQKLARKALDYAKKEWSLPSWDRAKIDAIASFYAGEIDEAATMKIIADQDWRAKEYRRKKHGR